MRFNLLSNPSKMPGRSFSLPALKACPWAMTEPKADGAPAVCAGCYARDGQYRMPNVVNTQAARYAWTKECMQSYRGQQMFEGALYAAIRKLRPVKGDEHVYFRIHDSGDFFSAKYVESWIRICEALPDVRFWAPTGSWLAADMINPGDAVPWIVHTLHWLNDLPNVTVRPSATHFGDPPPRVFGLSAGSSSGYAKAKYHCPAPQQGGKCESCRVCWDNPKRAVDYHVHGQAAKKLVRIHGVGGK